MTAAPPPRRKGTPRRLWEHHPGARAQWRVSQVYWLCLAFIALWLLLRAAGADPDAPPLQVGPFLSVLVLAIANLAARSWNALQRGGHGDSLTHNARGWIFTVLDLALISVGLRATGGIDSPLWIVLFVVVVAETVIVARDREAYLVRVAAVLALLAGTLPYPLSSPRFNLAYLLEFTTRFAFLLFVSMVTRRLRKNHEEAVRAAEAELAGLRSELAAADERARLAREIHDGMGNALAASVLRLELSARLMEKGAADAVSDTGPNIFRDEAKALREAMTAVRDWTYFTRPWSEDAAQEIDRLSRRTGLPMTITGAEHLSRLPAPALLAAQRILQEALTNAAKYAKEATRAEVSVVPDGKFLAVSIADDGCGFDPAQAGAGVGLSSMRERAEILGGSLVVDSSPGLGTTITARLPLTP